MTYKILSIDAWNNCCGCDCKENKPTCWTWNNWFILQQTYTTYDHGELNEKNAMKYFKQEFLKPNKSNKFEIIDDRYNFVLVEKCSQKPLLAIEYGSQN